MLIYGFFHSVAHRMFPCVAWRIITDKTGKLELLRSTRRPLKSMDIALSRKVNRQGQRNRAISNTGVYEIINNNNYVIYNGKDRNAICVVNKCRTIHMSRCVTKSNYNKMTCPPSNDSDKPENAEYGQPQ